MQSHQIRKYDSMPYHKRKCHPTDKMDMLLSKSSILPFGTKLGRSILPFETNLGSSILPFETFCLFLLRLLV